MKNTVFTVMTVLLLIATLCLPAAAQTWNLHASWAGPNDDRDTGSDIVDIEFRDNHQVFYGKYDRLYKWDFQAGRAHWFDYDGERVTHVEVPRNFSNAVIYSVNYRGYIYIKNADDLSSEASINAPGHRIETLSVDNHGEYLVTEVNGGGLGFPPGPSWCYYHQVYDIWGANGWQLSEVNSPSVNSSCLGPPQTLMHPTTDSGPRWYSISSSENVYERILEWTRSGHGDTYVTPSWSDIDAIAITDQYGSATNIRLAALDGANDIHVWNWSGDHLFTLNKSEDYSAHDDILEFTPNGEILVTAYGRNVRFWDVGAQALDHSFWVDDMDDDESIESLAFSDNGMLMALGSSDGTAYIYHWSGGSAPTAPAKETETQPTALLSNYPNPFNPETWIPYQLSEAAEVTVTIHSSDGKLVRTLELGQMPAGAYSDKERAAYWDGRNAQGEPVASGVYFYTLTAGDFSATRKMVIRK